MKKKLLKISVMIVLMGSVSLNIMLGSMYSMNKENTVKLSASLKEIEKDYDDLENLAEDKIEEICDLYYEKKLKELLPKEELDYLAFMAWEYEIKINDEDITSPTFYTRSDNVKVTLVEKKKSDFLPTRLVKQGRLLEEGGELENYINTEFHAEAEIDVSDDGENRMITFLYRNIEAGDVVTVRLDPVLIERMLLYDRINLKDDKIEIIKNK